MNDQPKNAIRRRFGDRRVVLPVVHCIDEHQVRVAVGVAHEAHADGVFLSNQGGLAFDHLAPLAQELAIDTPFIGLNLLGMTSVALYSAAHHKLDAVWSDRCDLSKHTRERARYEGLFFGGVAFKYQPAPSSIRDAVDFAIAEGVDVLTTSGVATGSQPALSKIVQMRTAMGPDHALAIASGIQANNVEPFLPYVDAFLVATGVESSFGTFDPGRLRALIEIVHDYDVTALTAG